VVSRRQVLQGAAASVGLAAATTVTRRLPQAWAVPPPSIVFVLVDDMRFDYRGLLNVFATGPWIDCTSAAAQTPMCAPSRASMLTGSYSWRTPVVSNPTSSNTPQLEANTVATRMRAAGYRTALVGKYMNDYPWTLGTNHVPPGWVDWAANRSPNWRPGALHETDYCFEWASDYLRSVGTAAPLFLWVAPKLPHDPYIPPSRYQNASPQVPPTPPSFNEADVSDKPLFVRRKARLTSEQIAAYNQDRLLIARDMLAINDGMKRIMSALTDTGRLNSTVVIFTSDNAVTLGEHRLDNKGFPYEESARVPFVVRYPGVARRSEWRPISLVDVPATACAIAGTTAPGTDGVSLIPLLTQAQSVRDGAYITPPDRLTWEGVRKIRYKYMEYTDGFRELYDLQTDPFELQNVAGRPAMASIQQQMRTTLNQLRL
jgi:N-acetylglucosamine-6-sulfatase